NLTQYPTSAAAEPGATGEPPGYLTSALLAAAGLPHLFTTRHFPGVRAPENPAAPFGTAAAQAVAARAGLDGAGAAFLKQVHGAEVRHARQAGLAGTGDALLTEEPGRPLAIFSADCLPVVIYDRAAPRLAVAHAGWRGTVQAVARAAVQAMITAGSRPEALVAAIGPSIGPCCYEVDRPVIDRLTAAFPDRWREWVTPKGPDARGEARWMLDLWKANEAQLVSAGITPARIDNLALCTSCRVDLLFSYRRGGGRGRLITSAAIPGGPAEAGGAC
ncbi:MAG TPA: peptidoglycan editing factor PgeF, partial [Candidatus Limnocylindrales bacterium]|nr:peptidoglycan editing factor PgeF [Candidatus Limnocylindrales bacterium]